MSSTNSQSGALQRPRRSIGGFDASKSMDKENATTDIGAARAATRKASRSKSLGPGGLDALKQSTGNRRASLAVPSKPPRSILKTAISTLPEIPPLKKRDSSSGSSRNTSTGEDASLTGSKVALRTEEEQQAAAREREERERRDARRKSLANRRVSFAAEATLHTFHEMEYNQDSTTSTDTSRRASAATDKSSGATSGELMPHPPMQQQPAIPDETPQPKRRRSSGINPATPFARDEDTATSAFSSDSEPADAVEELGDEEVDSSSSNSDSDDGTMMTVDDVTGTSIVSARSITSNEGSSTLDEALRLAASRAGGQPQPQDEQSADEDDEDDEEIIPSFGWIKKASQSSSSATAQAKDDTSMSMGMDMDMTGAIGGIIQPTVEDESAEEDNMTMDMTTAVGGILGHHEDSRNRAAVNHETPGQEDDATMDLTATVGSIKCQSMTTPGEEGMEDHEDMSMEMTAIMGGVLKGGHGGSTDSVYAGDPEALGDEEDEGTMDMTVAVGQILPSEEQQAPDEELDATMGMEMTTAIGAILNSDSNGKSQTHDQNTPQARHSMAGQESPKRRISLARGTSPGKPEQDGLWGFQGSGLRRSVGPSHGQAGEGRVSRSRTPEAAARRTPPEASSSPIKFSPVSTQAALGRDRATSPMKSNGSLAKTPSPTRSTRSLRSSSRTPSPVKDTTQSRRKSISRPQQQKQQLEATAPPVLLTPQKRTLSGHGADREGLGSPRVAALLDRRGSIGDAADAFVPGKRTVAFENPEEASTEVDGQRREDAEKESNRHALLQGDVADSSDQEEDSRNLRDRINNMSPRKNPLKGRKSLHVGSASGLLGKRPLELDDDEEEDEDDGVKRLKGHQASPVRNVRLDPPSANMGRLGRPSMLSPGRAVTPPSFSSPVKKGVSTPQGQTRFKDVRQNQTVHNVSFEDPTPRDAQELEEEVDEDDGRIHLQDFLNMTSIRFMELNTTKRRHTAAPSAFKNGDSAVDDDESLERCVVAGACTIPMLELYQHSCRELKKYISEGREMVKEIEVDTFEENPPLFREYMTATSDVKALMDNQFKNVRAHARLLSKAMWYEWRSKLQEGLKEGLIKISEGMVADEKVLVRQQSLVSSVLPSLLEGYEKLEEEHGDLQQVARELADCDPEELQGARDELVALDEDIAAKKQLIADLRLEHDRATQQASDLITQKEVCLMDIKMSDKVREECRGWTSSEVNELKGQVDALVDQHGWAITGLTGPNISLSYRSEIELVVDIEALKSHQPASSIDLWYIAHNRSVDPKPQRPESVFFLQCIRDYVRSLPSISPKTSSLSEILTIVKSSWDKARSVSSQISKLNLTFPTKVDKMSDSSIAISTSVLLVPLKTRVDVTLTLQDSSRSADVVISHEAKVIYGESFNEEKMKDFLASRIGSVVKKADGSEGETWSDVLVDLQKKLVLRGKKQ